MLGSSRFPAVVLANRPNVLWELDWETVPEHPTENRLLTRADIAIGDDTRAAREVIHSCVAVRARLTTGSMTAHLAPSGFASHP